LDVQGATRQSVVPQPIVQRLEVRPELAQPADAQAVHVGGRPPLEGGRAAGDASQEALPGDEDGAGRREWPTGPDAVELERLREPVRVVAIRPPDPIDRARERRRWGVAADEGARVCRPETAARRGA